MGWHIESDPLSAAQERLTRGGQPTWPAAQPNPRCAPAKVPGRLTWTRRELTIACPFHGAQRTFCPRGPRAFTIETFASEAGALIFEARRQQWKPSRTSSGDRRPSSPASTITCAATLPTHLRRRPSLVTDGNTVSGPCVSSSGHMLVSGAVVVSGRCGTLAGRCRSRRAKQPPHPTRRWRS